jgi:predicted nucleic acid-binding protein
VTYYFLDTSAFVRAFIVEAGERQIHGLVAGATANPPLLRLVLTDFTFLEALSAVLQKRDARLISNRLCADSLREIEELLIGPHGPYLVVRVSDIVPEVPAIIRRHRLRPGDAVHIAGALRSRESAAALKMVFVTCDAKQERAATAEGLDVWNPAL